jgi:hypothetical protein
LYGLGYTQRAGHVSRRVRMAIMSLLLVLGLAGASVAIPSPAKADESYTYYVWSYYRVGQYVGCADSVGSRTTVIFNFAQSTHYRIGLYYVEMRAPKTVNVVFNVAITDGNGTSIHPPIDRINAGQTYNWIINRTFYYPVYLSMTSTIGLGCKSHDQALFLPAG